MAVVNYWETKEGFVTQSEGKTVLRGAKAISRSKYYRLRRTQREQAKRLEEKQAKGDIFISSEGEVYF